MLGRLHVKLSREVGTQSPVQAGMVAQVTALKRNEQKEIISKFREFTQNYLIKQRKNFHFQQLKGLNVTTIMKSTRTKLSNPWGTNSFLDKTDKET